MQRKVLALRELRLTGNSVLEHVCKCLRWQFFGPCIALRCAIFYASMHLVFVRCLWVETASYSGCWATVGKAVRPMLLDCCLSVCLSVLSCPVCPVCL